MSANLSENVLYCPALPADTGHSDGCAAANRGSGGDGLRPAGADTPGSGVTAGLCQCPDSVAANEFACGSDGCLTRPISVLFWFTFCSPGMSSSSPELHVPWHIVLRINLVSTCVHCC